MTHIGAFQAKTHLSELLQKVEQGESFVITRRGKAVAELNPLNIKKTGLQPGWAKGSFKIADDFDEALEEFKDYM